MSKKPQTRREMYAEAADELRSLMAAPEGQRMKPVEKWFHAKAAHMCIEHVLAMREAHSDDARIMLILGFERRKMLLRHFVAKRLAEAAERPAETPQEAP